MFYDDLVGKTIVDIKQHRDYMLFMLSDGDVWIMFANGCMDDANLEHVGSNIDCLLNAPVLSASSTEYRHPTDRQTVVKEYYLVTGRGGVFITWFCEDFVDGDYMSDSEVFFVSYTDVLAPYEEDDPQFAVDYMSWDVAEDIWKYPEIKKIHEKKGEQ